MGDNKVYPAGKSSAPAAQAAPASSSPSPHSPAQKPVPPPRGTFVIQIPKEQIFSYPPPENAKDFQFQRKPRRSFCRRCFCCTFSLLLLLIVAAAIAAGVLYLVFRPKAPKYTVLDVAIRGFNLTGSSPMSPEFDVSIRAENRNQKIGIYYQSGSEVEVSHGDVSLSNGALPVFYQPSDNVTVFQTALKGSKLVLPSGVRMAMGKEQRKGNVPFGLRIKAPVKIKVGSVKTWKMTVKVKCDVTVDALNEKSKIVSKDCDYRVKLW